MNGNGVLIYKDALQEKELRKKFSPLCPLSCRFGHRQISNEGLHIAVASHQGQGFILQATLHAFPHTNPCHSFLSCTIFLKVLHSSNSSLLQPTSILLCKLSLQSYHPPSSSHGQTTGEHLYQSFHLPPSSLCNTPLFMHSGLCPST